MSDKPNINYIRGYLSESRQYPTHLIGDLSQLNANTIAVINWAEHLELSLSSCATAYARVEAERDSIRQAHTRLAASADQQAVQDLKNQLAQAQATIDGQQQNYEALLEASSESVAAVARVQELVSAAEARAVTADGDTRPTFLLTSAIQAAVDGTVTESR